MTLPLPVAVGDPVRASTIDALINAGSVAVSGTVFLTPTALNVAATTFVAFPAGRFSTPPLVFVSAVVTNPWQYAASCPTVSTAGATILLAQTTGGLVGRSVSWIAIDTP